MPSYRSFIAGTTTALAPVAAIPTTAAHFALWNGDPTKSYTIQSVAFTSIASAAAAFVGHLLCHVSPAVQPTITGTAANGPKAIDGLVGGSKALVASAVTLTSSQANGGIWHPVGMSVNGGAATATISMGAWQNVAGIYVIPPGGIFSMAVLCSAVGSATCDCFITWAEA